MTHHFQNSCSSRLCCFVTLPLVVSYYKELSSLNNNYSTTVLCLIFIHFSSIWKTPIPLQNSLFTDVSFDTSWAFVVRERTFTTLFFILRQIDQVYLSCCAWKKQGLRISETQAIQHLQIRSNKTEKNLLFVALR